VPDHEYYIFNTLGSKDSEGQKIVLLLLFFWGVHVESVYLQRVNAVYTGKTSVGDVG